MFYLSKTVRLQVRKDILARTHHSEDLNPVFENFVHDSIALLEHFTKVAHLEFRDYPAGVGEL
jgi:hypothetical protein